MQTHCTPTPAAEIRPVIVYDRPVTIARLRTIPAGSVFGYTIHQYLNAKERTNEDIWRDCVQMIKDQIKDCPRDTERVIGNKAFRYFRDLIKA